MVAFHKNFTSSPYLGFLRSKPLCIKYLTPEILSMNSSLTFGPLNDHFAFLYLNTTECASFPPGNLAGKAKLMKKLLDPD